MKDEDDNHMIIDNPGELWDKIRIFWPKKKNRTKQVDHLYRSKKCLMEFSIF